LDIVRKMKAGARDHSRASYRHLTLMLLIMPFSLHTFYVSGQLIIDAGPDREVCAGSETILGGQPVVSGGSGDYLYEWEPADMIELPHNPTPKVSPKASTIYRLRVTDNATLQQATDSVTLTVKPLPKVNAGEDQKICLTGNIISVSLGGKISNNQSGLWTTLGDGTFPAGNTNLFTSYSLGAQDKMNDSVVIFLTSVADSTCPAVSDPLTLYISPKIRAEAGADTFFCLVSDTFSLKGTISGGTTTGVWSANGSGHFIAGTDQLVNKYVFSAGDRDQQAILFSLVSTNNGGCPGHSDTIAVIFQHPPWIGAQGDTMVHARGITVKAKAHNAKNVRWATNGSGRFYPSDTCKTTRYYFSPEEVRSGTGITIEIHTADSGMCPDSKDQFIATCTLGDMPNAFTPNDDGINDVFLQGEEITIYNRWGQLLYSGQDGWDGKYKGETVASGTYFYILKYLGTDKQEVEKGSVTVIID
jgi:gliding motility-associated-like protein